MTKQRLSDEELARTLEQDRKTMRVVCDRPDEAPPWLENHIRALLELQERRAISFDQRTCEARTERLLKWLSQLENSWTTGGQNPYAEAANTILQLSQELTRAKRQPSAVQIYGTLTARDPEDVTHVLWVRTGLWWETLPTSAPETTMGQVEPFVVKHYAADERPSIKGNGFDGLEVGEDRQDAEDFVKWLNERLVVEPTPELPCPPGVTAKNWTLPFTHWSKDPLVPYNGCGCSSCEDARASENRSGDA